MAESKNATTARGGTAAKCERCGGGNAKKFGDRWLCRECFQLSGSCCLEFGGDDLWTGVLQEPGHTVKR